SKIIKNLQDAARKEILPLPGVGKDDLEGVIDRAEANEAAKGKQKVYML
ncbi:pescadillo-like protein, partial [Trifolium medium]|nr:pescadillo-like protein [Trifolium medium]